MNKDYQIDNGTADNQITDNKTVDSISAETATVIQPDITGYFPLYGNIRPKIAPTEGIFDTIPNGKCADVFSDEIAVIQIENNSVADKIIRILEKLGIRYHAVASKSKMRLFFRNNGLNGNYKGTTLCGVAAEIAGDKGYLDHLAGNMTVIHVESGNYNTIPLWLALVKDASPLNSDIYMFGETKWTDYMKQVYFWLTKNGKYSREEAYSATIETAKVLNSHFRKQPFNEQRMTAFLDIADIEFDIKNFYDEEIDPNGKPKTVFQKDMFAEWFINRYRLINLDHIAHRYSNGVYIPVMEKDCEILLHKYLKNSNSSLRKEIVQTVFSVLGIYACETTCDADMTYALHKRCKPEMIAFNNGIYNICTGEWHDFDPDIIITNRIPVDYVDFEQQISNGEKNDAMKTIDEWLDSFSENNPEKRTVLEEVAGLALYIRNTGLRRQHTILVGQKQSGKSTYIKMVEKLIGEQNCSHVALEDICNPNDRFCTYSLVGKTINSYADISDAPVKSTARIKNICTCDAIRVEQKNQPATTMVWQGKMIFGCNSFPHISDPALTDRFEFIPCNANYNSADGTCIPDLYDILTKPECMRYWCYLTVQGLRRFIKNGYKHTYCKEIEQLRREYIRCQNPVAAFIDAVPEDEINKVRTSEVFRKYTEFCINDLGIPKAEVSSFSINSLTSSLKRLGYIAKRGSDNNKKIQKYVKFV